MKFLKAIQISSNATMKFRHKSDMFSHKMSGIEIDYQYVVCFSRVIFLQKIRHYID